MSWWKRWLGRGEEPPPSGSDIGPLLEDGWRHLAQLTQANQEAWRFGQHERWELDYESGTLTFTFADGEVVTCSAQAIGSFDASTETWMWAWCNESLKRFPALLSDAQRVWDYGREHLLAELVTPALPSEMNQCWAFTGLAVKLCGATGAYCGTSGPLHMFLALHDVRPGRPRPDAGPHEAGGAGSTP